MKQKGERNMSKSKIVGMVALIAFAMGIVLVGDAVAGEKHKLSTVYHTVKWEQMNVPGEEGHVIAVWDGKGVTRNKDGKPFGEGLIVHTVGYFDWNMKAGIGDGHFYTELTDRDGDKIYTNGPGKQKIGEIGPYLQGTDTMTRGIGKYEGIRGGFTYKCYQLSPDQMYADWDVEVELPR
jgi:hypothetical protein